MPHEIWLDLDPRRLSEPRALAEEFNQRGRDLALAVHEQIEALTFADIGGVATRAQLPPEVAYEDEGNVFTVDQVFSANLLPNANDLRFIGVAGSGFRHVQIEHDVNRADGLVLQQNAAAAQSPRVFFYNSNDGTGTGLALLGRNNLFEVRTEATPSVSSGTLRFTVGISAIQYNGNPVWHSANDGAGSTLDSDLLDGQHGSFYQSASNINAGTLADARLSSNVALLTGAQTFSGQKTFGAGLIVAAGQHHSNARTENTDTGTVNAWNIGNAGFVTWNGASNLVVNGIAGGVDGRVLWLSTPSSAATITLVNESGSAAAADRIRVGGASGALNIGAILMYDGQQSRWRVLGFN